MTSALENILLARNICIALVIILVLIMIIFAFCENVIIPFLDERSYIKMEINRSDSSSERRYWKKKLRKSYLKQIPLIGLFFK